MLKLRISRPTPLLLFALVILFVLVVLMTVVTVLPMLSAGRRLNNPYGQHTVQHGPQADMMSDDDLGTILHEFRGSRPGGVKWARVGVAEGTDTWFIIAFTYSSGQGEDVVLASPAWSGPQGELTEKIFTSQRAWLEKHGLSGFHTSIAPPPTAYRRNQQTGDMAFVFTDSSDLTHVVIIGAKGATQLSPEVAAIISRGQSHTPINSPRDISHLRLFEYHQPNDEAPE